MATSEDRYKAPALDKGLDILELLARQDGGITQAEIGKLLGRKQAEFYRMLERLVRRGYVVRSDGDLYSLSLKLMDLSHIYKPTRRLSAIAKPIMQRLSAATLQPCHMTVVDGGSAVIVAQQEPDEYWAVSVRLGATFDLLSTSSGSILLAFQTEEDRQAILRSNRSVDSEAYLDPAFLQALKQVRAQGYDMRESEQTENIYNLAAPILGSENNAIAALVIPYAQRKKRKDALDLPDRDACLALLQEAAREISALTGWTCDADSICEDDTTS